MLASSGLIERLRGVFISMKTWKNVVRAFRSAACNLLLSSVKAGLFDLFDVSEALRANIVI